MFAKPEKEHEWLHKMVGEWTFELEGMMGPDTPPHKGSGTETVRSLGGLWVICDGQHVMPGGEMGHHTIMTLGYDPAIKKYVGSFIGSMMAMQWVYEGELDPSGEKLNLNADGPSFFAEGKMTKYIDTVEFINDDHRTLSSQALTEDGKWVPFMTAHYRRKT